MSNNIYCGKAKVVPTKYGDIMKVNLTLTQIPKEFIREFEAKDGKHKAINLDVVEMKEPDKFGNTHTVKVDTYKKEEQSNDLPF